MASQSQVDEFLEKERLGELTAAQELAVANQRAKGNFPPPLEQIDTLEGTGRAVVQGGFFGGGDEVVAGGVALKNELLQLAPETFQGIGDYLGLPGSFSSVDRPMGEVYDASLGSERSDLGQFREEQPVIAYGSEILGSMRTSPPGPSNRRSCCGAGRWCYQKCHANCKPWKVIGSENACRLRRWCSGGLSVWIQRGRGRCRSTF